MTDHYCLECGRRFSTVRNARECAKRDRAAEGNGKLEVDK